MKCISAVNLRVNLRVDSGQLMVIFRQGDSDGWFANKKGADGRL